jgi:uncharacterized protein (DUF2267 family)
MDIFQYIDFVKERLKELHEKGDKEEACRITLVLIQALKDKVIEWGGRP